MAEAAPNVQTLLITLPKARLVDLGRQFGVAIAKPNGVPKEESVARLVGSRQLVFRDLVEWMRCDELRLACRKLGVDARGRTRGVLSEALLRAHGAASVPPVSIFGVSRDPRDDPQPGDIARVRRRQYLVQAVRPSEPLEAGEVSAPSSALTRVDLVCLDDDQQGRPLSVLWELELGAHVSRPSDGLGEVTRIDPPRHFSAYVHALKWNSVTASDGRLLQAPFRAGIRLLNHQLTPLIKALALPRCNLFIADDVGLGKTIEAGLVLQELQLRQRVEFVLIVCPASICLQWQREMERRFGQHFEIYDREFVLRRRQERGFGVIPWTTHHRFIVSYHTLKRAEHREPLFQHLGKRLSKSLLVLDEAHTVAPSAPSQYALDSELTHLARRLAPPFENRLFLSATPHNGHSNSFSTLLELLDPQRFTRGVPVEAGSKALEEVMVRRLKRDLQDAALGKFPKRHVVRVALREVGEAVVARFDQGPDLPLRTLDDRGLPELRLSQMLTEYSALERPKRGPGTYVFINLQKRLLSSIEAFHRTLQAHIKRLVERFGSNVLADAGPNEPAPAPARGASGPDVAPGGGDAWGDESTTRDADEDELDRALDAQADVGTRALKPPCRRARELLRDMVALSERTRYEPDAKVLTLLDWIRDNLCADVGLGRSRRPSAGRAAWAPKRVILFTEYADTKRYLTQILQSAVEGCSDAERRILGFHGAMSDEQRERVQTAFNADPEKEPARILIATDAAREGLNLQNYCAHLFHIDVPWNPARLEQRNGRIDRTLQPADDVWCHYFVYPDRTEDAVLDRLVEKIDRIQRELGTLGEVVVQRVERAMSQGIHGGTSAELDAAEQFTPRERSAKDELESQRLTTERLRADSDEAAKILERSARRIEFGADLLREAVNVGLELATGGAGLQKLDGAALRAQGLAPGSQVDMLPTLPPSWARTLDSLRPTRERDESERDWRARPLQPVVFEPLDRVGEDRVHLHLEHPLVQRLLSRFLSQGYSAHDLSRVTIVPSDRDHVVRVIAFARVSLFGRGATRLHDAVLTVAAQWLENGGEGHLRPFADAAENRAVTQLDDIFARGKSVAVVPERVCRRVLESASADFAALWPALLARAEAEGQDAVQKLGARGEEEARSLRRIIEAQRGRIEQAQQLGLDFANPNADETEQLRNERDHMKRRLVAIQEELESEPAQLKALYDVVLTRREPVGLVYLWPVTKLG
jgi:SNF2-related domain/Helicase conserved C-terminal domain